MGMSNQSQGVLLVASSGGRLNPKYTNPNTTTNCPAAPFANKLRDFSASQTIRIFFGGHDAWNRAKDDIAKGCPALCLPVGERPEERSWACLRGRSIVAVEIDDCGTGFRVSMVRLLAAWGAREVALIPFDCSPANAVFWRV